MPRGKVDGPDPSWAGAQPFEEDKTPGFPPTPQILSLVNAPPTARSEFTQQAPVDQAVPEFLRGSGGGTPQPDPIQVTGVSRRMQIDPIELNGSSGVTQIANRGMPGGGNADKYPEPPTSPQAAQGIPAMLARQPDAQKARAAAKPKMAAVVAPGQAQTPSRPVTDSGSSTTPDFDAFVAQRAREIADLKKAQGTADDARKWQDVANGFVRAGDTVAGRKTDEGALQQRLDNTYTPVQNVLQQQQVGRQATQDALAQTNLSGKMWEQRQATQAADPNSPLSQRTQQFLAGTGLFKPGTEKFISAADYEKALQAGAAGIHALALKAQINHQNAELEIQRGNAAENIRHHDQQYEIGTFRARPSVQPTQQKEIEALINGAASLHDLEGVNKGAGFFDRLGSVVGVGPAAETRKAISPEVAKANSGGRVNPAGEVKEANSLPGPNTVGGQANTSTRKHNMLRLADTKIRVMESDPKLQQDSVAQMRQQLNDEIARQGGTGGGTSQAAPTGPTHYLVNRAQGIRIAAGEDGKPILGAKPERIPDGG